MPPIERLAERPITVDPRAIEDEFTRIWQETSAAGADDSTVRLRVLNFVAIGRDTGDVDRFEEVMHALPQRHPCRGILAVASPAHDRLTATLSAHCWRSEGDKRHVCSEEVLLAGGAGQERELASAVLPLLVPEVPVMAWLMDASPAGGYLASEALEAADCAIVDSARAPDLRAAFRAAIDMIGAHEIDLTDLAWMRLEIWRTLAAQLFDGDDGPRELAQLHALEIIAGAGAESAEAVLLGAWFVSRLGLTIADLSRSAGRLVATLYDGTRAVTLTLAAQSTATQAITELKIRTADAEFIIASHPESGHMHVRENWDGGSSRRTVERAPVDDGSTIALALDAVSDGGVFEDALRTALLLLGG